MNCWVELIALPSIAVTTSPGRRPAVEAGEPPWTDEICAPPLELAFRNAPT